jgi:dATP/dGTP diphosphohydrolase, N-terminal
MPEYVTRDSGQREQYDTGMVRDTEEGKARFDLMFPAEVAYQDQFLTRLAMLLARGAEKYGERNWESGYDEKALARAKSSALRHLVQWVCGLDDEDHAAAVVFNLMQAEYLKYRMRAEMDELRDIELAAVRA